MKYLIGRYHDNPNLLNELLMRDFVSKIEPLFQLGWHISLKTGKVALRPGFSGIDHNTNWIHTHPDPDRHCKWYQLIHAHCNFIPQRCLDCWKVVVRPKSLFQLLKLYELQIKLSEENDKCFCKCGWEDRPWVDGHYGGYFYCNSKEEGLDRLETVEFHVHHYIKDCVDVFLKRYCTEFELKWGDSAKYEKTPEAEILETAIYEGSEVADLHSPQPQWLKDHIMADWIIKANGTPDPTAKFYNNNKPLYTPVRRYYKEVKNGKG
jgi:hypothetical protein